MKVSRQQLASFSLTDDVFFRTTAERNQYFQVEPEAGTYCAVAGDVNVDMTDQTSALWSLHQFNGVNWILATIDENFALIVTNKGLAALTHAQKGLYKFEISRVVIRQDVVPTGSNVYSWEKVDFEKNIVLDSSEEDPSSVFTLEKNVTHRINMANGGIQYCVYLDVNTSGFDNKTKSVLSTYKVGAVGLYIRDENNTEILFAVGNLKDSIVKYVTTPTRVGNAIKLYLNTTLTNLGYISDLRLLPETIEGIPEAVTETDLPAKWDGSSTPHNIVLVDDYKHTNIPALAVRSGNPVIGEKINWIYFKPTEDSISITNPDLFSSDLKDYMVAAYDSILKKYVPASTEEVHQKVQGIKVGNNIIFSGSVRNSYVPFSYNIEVTNTGENYSIGDLLKYTYTDGSNTQTFSITVQNVNSRGGVTQISFTPTTGDIDINKSDISPSYVGQGSGSNLKVKITSIAVATSSIKWDFDDEWINKPLYVDPNKPGYLTVEENEAFVGWCNDNITVTLALDMRNDSTYTEKGVTRYATEDEVIDLQHNTAAKDITAITPASIQPNFLQITKKSGNPGDEISNRIHVKTHVQYDEILLGKGITDISDTTINMLNQQNVSFYGVAYRSLYADLAEYYRSDAIYPAGTLVCLGDGIAECTIAKTECNGIVSSHPGYELGEKKDNYDLPIALCGKVPVRFALDCMPEFGDRIYLSKNEPGCASTIPNGKCLGKIIDKRPNLDRIQGIMCVVRIEF